MAGTLCGLLFFIFLAVRSAIEGLSTKAQTNVILLPGDVVIGGLSPIHYPVKDEKAAIKNDGCNGSFNFRGLQHAEAILFAVDEINKDPNLLPGIKLGVEIRDTCNSVDHAIRETLQFSFVQEAYRGTEENVQCMGKTRVQNTTGETVAIVGAAYSGISMAVTSLAGLFYVPVVSYASTSRLLEDQSRFKYFLRTVPSDTLQAQAMVAIIKEFKWNFVSTVASDTEYGRSGIEAFRTAVRMSNYSVCIAVNALFTTRTEKTRVRRIIDTLRDHPQARVIILFAEQNDAKYFIENAKEQKLKEKIWIGSDAFSRSYDVFDGNKDILEHWLSTSPEVMEYKPFINYFMNLTQRQNHDSRRNPWISRYETVIAKQLNSSDHLDLSVYTTTAIDAVYTVAHGLHTMYECNQDGCRKNVSDMDQTKVYDFIRNVSFVSPTGNCISFDKSESAASRYEIVYVKKVPTGKPIFETLGKWNLKRGFRFMRDSNRSQNPFLDKSLFSSCSLDCAPGYRKTSLDKFPTCCWKCSRCHGNSITNKSGLTACITCPLGTRANQEKSSCDVIAPTLIVKTTAGLAVVGMYTLGMALDLGTLIVFVTHRQSAVVRASSRELSYIILCGIAWNLANALIVMIRPTTILCQLRPFISSIGMTVVMGSLLSKTNRISRIFSLKAMRTGRTHFASKKWQLTFVFLCVLLGNTVSAVWVAISPFKVISVPHSHYRVTIECSEDTGVGFATWATYHVGLTLLCTYQAFLVRKVPENYNEAKFIAFTMVTVCLSGAVFVPTYYGTSGVYRTVLTASLYLFCSYSTLFCLFAPKLYIILLRPEKNQPFAPRVGSNRPKYGRSISALAVLTTSSNSSSMGIQNQTLSFNSLNR